MLVVVAVVFVVVFVVVLVVVAVVVMDVYVTVDWMQYKFLSTYPSNELYVVGTASCWNASY